MAVVLIPWWSSCLLSVQKLSGDNLLTFSSNLLNHHVVFLVGNMIIALCYVLSRPTEEENRSENYRSSSQRKTTEDDDFRIELVTPEERQMTEEMSKRKNLTRKVITRMTVKTESETAIEVVIKEALKRIERFRRIQSENFKRGKAGRRRLLVDKRSLEMVEKLSNEEFQLAVETFISKQHNFLKQEELNCD